MRGCGGAVAQWVGPQSCSPVGLGFKSRLGCLATDWRPVLGVSPPPPALRPVSSAVTFSHLSNMPMVCRLKFYLLLLFTLESCHITESHKHQHGDRRLSSSIHFTRRIRSRIQTLLMHYKEQELGDSKFEDRSLMLKTLPSLNTDYFTWLHMKDTERLNRALRDLNIFLIHLDANRKQIEEGMNGQTDTVTRSMYGVQLD
uniref:Uncharacterized protein n=1 Tax=Scleropages formosus TaxID=113540 RepID=A0A8C9SRE3_SCLFO